MAVDGCSIDFIKIERARCIAPAGGVGQFVKEAE